LPARPRPPAQRSTGCVPPTPRRLPRRSREDTTRRLRPSRRGGGGRSSFAKFARRATRRSPRPSEEGSRVAARKKKRGLRPRLASRVERRKRSRSARAQPHRNHSELWGLGLVALGLFLAIVLYGGWDGGMVGGPVADALDGLFGVAAYLAPLALAAVGILMVARSQLVDFRPFRAGLLVLSIGLLITLGSAHGGFFGELLGGGLGKLLGPGAPILGVLAIVVGALLLTGASAGAIIRRSHRAVRTAATRRARPAPAATPQPKAAAGKRKKPPLDAVEAFPDVVGGAEPPPLLVQPEPLVEDPPTLFDTITSEEHSEYVLPDRGLLRRSESSGKADPEAADRVGEALLQTLEHFGIEADLVGRIAGPRVTRYEL